MKKSILTLAFTAAIAFSGAQGLGGAYLIDIKDGRTRPVVITTLGEIKRPLGLGFNLALDAFAGVDAGIYPGFSIGYASPVAENVRFKLGPAFTLENERIRFPGFIVGFEIRF